MHMPWMRIACYHVHVHVLTCSLSYCRASASMWSSSTYLPTYLPAYLLTYLPLTTHQACRVEESEISHLGYTGVSLGWEWGYQRPSGASANV